MGDPRSQGYQAVFGGLRTRSSQAHDYATLLFNLRSRLDETFAEVGNPLGDDHYGAELEKKRYKIEDGVFDAFTTYIWQVEDMRDGLRDNSRNYEDAEGYTRDDGYDGYDGYGSSGTEDLPDTSLNDLPSDPTDPAYPQGW
ncbi:hypothetical protein MF672_012940 [Actinomadura sp. ATCC 31491]|uniref:Uncharacterized protein n=1 Tax=Actinomadura luzonensis TaxID=2805427 RepID=A0ABT0FS11_9ACTN|nr:hypothetical protein [Actinomadura luzonensis]MCK2214693.1 hypothetical protein [Actinomadura luzonensis]